VGVRFNRDYPDILADLSGVLAQLPASAEFVEMNQADWLKLSPKTRREMAETIADDIFYALGDEAKIEIGDLTIEYDASLHRIFVHTLDGKAHIIKLI
jgi:hypothetical protein